MFMLLTFFAINDHLEWQYRIKAGEGIILNCSKYSHAHRSLMQSVLILIEGDD